MQHVKETPPAAARITEQLIEYWRILKGARPYPLEEEVNPDEIAAIWPSCFLVQVLDQKSFSYTYLGDALIAAYGDDWIGREITESLVYPHPASLFKAFRVAVRQGVPVADEGEFRNASEVLIKYRSCIVPLGIRSREGVNYLLGGMKWKMY